MTESTSPCAESFRNEDGGGRDHAFISMLRSFRPSGGLARASELLDETKGAAICDPPETSDPMICFEWGGSLWVPRFQFCASSRRIKPGCAQVLSELSGVFDGWEMAMWFCSSNIWLGGACPVDLVESSLAAVLGAARADRFIATG